MNRKNTSSASYYEIVKYNLKTRKDINALPEQFHVLSEVNDKIATLNARLKSSKEDEGGDIIYFRRRVRV